MSFVVDAGTANAPESGKPFLRPRMPRSLGLLKWAEKERLDFLCVQESGTVLQAAMRKARKVATDRARKAGRATKDHRTGWGSHYAPATAHGGAGRRRGNGVLWQRRDWRLVQAADEKVRWAESPTGWLYIPVVLLEERRTGVQIFCASVHAPTKRADDDGDTRRAINDAVLEMVAKAKEKEIPLVVGGDFNDADLHADLGLRRKGALNVAAHHAVDWLLTTARPVKASERVHPLKKWRLSDHQAVTARIDLEPSNKK